jgi:hypothetical protein
VTYNELNYKTTWAMLRDLMDGEEFETISQNLSKLDRINSTKMLARNIFILSRLLSNERTLTAPSVRAMLRFCPIDTLVTLNSYRRATKGEDEKGGEDMDRFLRTFDLQCLRLIFFPSHRLPAEIRKQTFLDIGYSEAECQRLLLSPYGTFEDASNRHLTSSPKLQIDSVDYVTVMSERLRILRKNAHVLALHDPCHLFFIMTNWTPFLEGLAIGGGAIKMKRVLWSGNKAQLSMAEKMEGVAFSSLNSNSTSSILANYFGAHNPEAAARLQTETFVSAHFQTTPSSRVSKAIELLESRGFSKKQMRQATQLLFYPAPVIERHLEAAEAGVLVKERSEDYFLRMLLYLVEKEINFSADGLCTNFEAGEADRMLSDDLKAAIKFVSKPEAETSPTAATTATLASQSLSRPVQYAAPSPFLPPNVGANPGWENQENYNLLPAQQIAIKNYLTSCSVQVT